MCEFYNFDGGDPFVQPEKPFMLIYKDKKDTLNVAWLDSKEDLLTVVDEVKRYGCGIIDAIEIAGCRDIKID